MKHATMEKVSQRIPNKRGIPFLGNTLSLRKEPLQFLQQSYNEFGSISCFYAFGKRMIAMLGPDCNQFVFENPEIFSNKGFKSILGEIFPDSLVEKDGEEHKELRETIKPFFKLSNMPPLLQIFNPIIEKHLSVWHKQQVITTYPAVVKLLLEDMIHAVAGISNQKDVIHITQLLREMIHGAFSPLRFSLPGFAYGRGVKAQHIFSRIIKNHVPQKREKEQEVNLLSHLCHARKHNGEYLSDDEISNLISIVMGAGHDTSGHALTWILYYLALNPDIQEKAREEILSFNDNYLSAENAKELTTITLVFNEVLRLKPSILFLPYITTQEFVYGNYKIPAEENVVISPVFTHYMSEYWNEPYEFNPHRFNEENNEHRKHHKYAWIPFGGGPHGCPGSYLGLLHMKAILYQLLRKYRLNFHKNKNFRYRYFPTIKFKGTFELKITTLTK